MQGERLPSFVGWLTMLLLTSVVVPLLLPVLPVVPSARAQQLSDELSEVTASAYRLDQLFGAERHIVDWLEQFVRLSERKLRHAKRYLDSYRHDSPISRPSNPVRDFKLLQRVEELWKEDLVPNELLSVLSSVQSEVARFVDNDGTGPGGAEAIETISALVTIQHMYLIDPIELAEGNLLGLDTGNKLSIADMLKLAEVTAGSNSLDLSLVWLEAGLRVAERRNQTDWIPIMRSKLEETMHLHDQKLASDDKSKTGLFSIPIAGLSPWDEQLDREENINTIHKDKLRKMGALCRGEELRDSSKLSRLYCTYEKPHPYLFLMPLKTEVQNFEPYVCIYHDFLHLRDRARIIDISTPKMERSGINTGDTSKARVSVTARLPDTADPAVESLSRRVQMATGMDTANRTGYRQETLQVCEYGTGGFFHLHADYFGFAINQTMVDHANRNEVQMGDRVATLLIYLSRVLRGGHTIFPHLNLTVAPEPGSAVYFENLKPDGTPDERSLHSGCPVAYGYKWIANKFIRYNAQTFTWPCPLKNASAGDRKP